MKKSVLSVFLFALILSTSAFASMPDFSILNSTENLNLGLANGPGKIHECMRAGWKAAKPSDDQNTQARTFVKQAKDVVDSHKPAIREALRALMGAWKKHPVLKDDVAAAESRLFDTSTPARVAIRDAQIDIIDLLSGEQRKAFNQGFFKCIRPGK